MLRRKQPTDSGRRLQGLDATDDASNRSYIRSLGVTALSIVEINGTVADVSPAFANKFVVYNPTTPASTGQQITMCAGLEMGCSLHPPVAYWRRRRWSSSMPRRTRCLLCPTQRKDASDVVCYPALVTGYPSGTIMSMNSYNKLAPMGCNRCASRRAPTDAAVLKVWKTGSSTVSPRGKGTDPVTLLQE